MLPKRTIATGVGAVVVAGGVAVGGVATADSATSSTHQSTSTTTTTTGTSTGAQNGFRHARPGLRRALHGEFVARGRDGKNVTVDLVRGKVTAVSPTSITITSRDGYAATYTVTSDTRVHVRGKKGTQPISAVKTGDRAGAFGTKSGGTVDARVILDHGRT
jgi:hypothetical protein